LYRTINSTKKKKTLQSYYELKRKLTI